MSLIRVKRIVCFEIFARVRPRMRGEKLERRAQAILVTIGVVQAEEARSSPMNIDDVLFAPRREPIAHVSNAARERARASAKTS